jgi:hypothetical protein
MIEKVGERLNIEFERMVIGFIKKWERAQTNKWIKREYKYLAEWNKENNAGCKRAIQWRYRNSENKNPIEILKIKSSKSQIKNKISTFQ